MDPFDSRAGIALKMHQKTASLMLEIPESSHDGDYAEIILLARQLLPKPVSIIGNTATLLAPATCIMDSGAMAPLYFVATNSRNTSLRQEALSLLTSPRRHDVIWDGALVARIVRRYWQLKETDPVAKICGSPQPGPAPVPQQRER